MISQTSVVYFPCPLLLSILLRVIFHIVNFPDMINVTFVISSSCKQPFLFLQMTSFFAAYIFQNNH
ncbi:hypothetical protein CCY16_00856 [Wolbachia endosymbiont of Wuchereria bancrofti]|nr:hypothetical protein CCY16_00856 [Wolbachia endosymbiont of Wuchereria bancrofti]